jgi:hypothetical protein
MSVVKFELKEEHIKLLTGLRWNLNYASKTYRLPFVEEEVDELINVHEEVDIVLNGFEKPQSFDAAAEQINEEKKLEYNKLLSELPTALDIILFTKSYETGWYKTKYNIRSWKKI